MGFIDGEKGITMTIITTRGSRIGKAAYLRNLRRLINQIYKILPLKEERNPDWKKGLKSIIVEVNGLDILFGDKMSFLVLLTKLEGLFYEEEHLIFRKTIFECIAILEELAKQCDEQSSIDED